MPHDPKRIEAAARALKEFDLFVLGETGQWREAVTIILDAAYPEFSSDPPSAWLAPWSMTGLMIRASTLAVDLADGDISPVRLNAEEVQEIYDAARDAHTKDQT